MSPTTNSPTQNRVAELEQAFNEFTRTSLQLEEAYRELEERVEILSSALAQAQDERLVQLAEKEKLADRLQGLLETLPAGVIVLDGDGVIQECNPGATALLGDELAGHTWMEIVEDRFAMEGDAAGEFMLHSGYEVEVRSCLLQAHSGRIVLINDITETRRMQRVLTRNQRLTEMGQMNARLAHQLRTPLATALLYASQLTGKNGTERSNKYAGKILGSLKSLERMVNDMLRFAGGNSGGSDEEIAINELFAEVAAHMEAHLGDGTILEFGAASGLNINGNREALAGALLNLANNAVENSSAGAHIVMSAARTDDEAVITVSDDGPGIADELKQKVFEPFYTTRSNGTGLGLAVVASVARAHGGRVELRDADDGGTAFSIVLPVIETPAIPSGRKASSIVEAVGEVA